MLEQLDIPVQKKINLDTDFTPFTKTNSKWMMDPNVKCKSIKLLEDVTGENLDDLRYGDAFLNIIPKTHNPRKKQPVIRWISLKLKTFELQKTNSRE